MAKKEPRKESPSEALAVAAQRHKEAESDTATEQEKVQAATELADVSPDRPHGSHAGLHQAAEHAVAVPGQTKLEKVD